MQINFDLDFEGETYSIEAEVDITVDHNYGADADGNRGCSREFRETENYTVYKDGKSLSKWAIPSGLENEIYSHVDEMEIEPEDDGPDPDEDVNDSLD